MKASTRQSKQMRPRALAALLLSLPLLLLLVRRARADEAAAPTWEPTEAYEVRQVEGWTVRVNRALLNDQPETGAKVLRLLEVQLYLAKRVLPAAAVAKLQGVVIWMELEKPHSPGGVYHPDPRWLRSHGVNPDKARCVEFPNARNFLTWTKDQPCMVLHELAHAWHHQFLKGGYANAEIRAGFERATRAGLYEKVQHINGRDQKAYAANNPMEYFAEATEAFFGTNDFYPFVRSELRRHDPDTYRMLEKAWAAEE